jgi:hypothetical protein
MTPAEKFCLWVAIVLIVVGILREWFDSRLKRPLTKDDLYYSWADVRLDELEAREKCRPHGSVDRVYGDSDMSRWSA